MNVLQKYGLSKKFCLESVTALENQALELVRQEAIKKVQKVKLVQKQEFVTSENFINESRDVKD